MNKQDHNSRLQLLLLKVKTNRPLTESEQAEYERLKGIRIVETSGGGPLIVEPANKPDAHNWNEYIRQRNEQLRQRVENPPE